jgi:orc1/cdc6 family replication initiation protein
MDFDDVVDAPTTLNPTHIPETIVNRDDEQAGLVDSLTAADARNLYLYGSRGTGKTLLIRKFLQDHPHNTRTCYISCIQFDTQYQVLRQLYRSLTDEDINNGYHTAQLQQRIEDRLSDHNLILVLDEIDFLLENDGSDLLYYLSRMEHSDNISLVMISANHPNPRTVIGDRALSSLQPWYLTFEPYTAEQAYEILQERLREASMLDSVTREALTLIVATTRNIQLGLHWLEQAAATPNEQITEELLRNIKSAAAQRYRDVLLTNFSPHHHLLLEAISQLVTERDEGVRAGAVYDRYQELCESTSRDVLTNRRISDFITHLALLDIIDIDHHSGGKEGRTREIRLNELL